ncbi:MAG: hypothetical protein U0990_09575 [Candidatus Nanopelagicales bacterium]|nr:hypothetical protein [Candidatus Nanopelagicales bacterium]
MTTRRSFLSGVLAVLASVYAPGCVVDALAGLNKRRVTYFLGNGGRWGDPLNWSDGTPAVGVTVMIGRHEVNGAMGITGSAVVRVVNGGDEEESLKLASVFIPAGDQGRLTGGAP